MSALNIRNAIALLLVLTAANLAASFAALYAVRMIRDDSTKNLQKIEETTAYLGATVATLCTRTSTVCPPPPDPNQ